MEISKIINKHQLSYKTAKENTQVNPLQIKSDLNTLKFAFDAIAKNICFTRSNIEYEYDKDNVEQITEILKYLLCDSSCKYSLNKGLFLMGGVGTGKTIIIEIIKEMVQASRKMIEIYDAKEINMMYKDDEQILKLQRGIICIDDLGTEESNIKDFGTNISPMFDLLTARYRKNRFTLITSNLDHKEMKEKYDLRFLDRCNEMFNIIPFTGKSRRK